MGRAVKAGMIDQGVADWFISGDAGFYGNYDNDRLVRDEVIRSASFAAMNLCWLPTPRGWPAGTDDRLRSIAETWPSTKARRSKSRAAAVAADDAATSRASARRDLHATASRR